MVHLGLTFYDLVTRKSRQMPRHSAMSRTKSLARQPRLNPDIVATATYHDAWISYPERLCLELLLDGELAHTEARAMNYVSLRDATGETVTLHDEMSDQTIQVKPQVVVNATGAWIDFTNRSLKHDTQMISGTKGAHLVLDNDELYEALNGGMIFYETDDSRVSIALPWLGKSLIGSTDIRIDNPDEVRVTEEEIDYIIESIRQVLPDIDVNRSQILSHFTGVRPLQYNDGSVTGQVSRDHHCAVTEPNEDIRFPTYSMIGGKWTTFRAFAEQVTDRLLDHLGGKRRAETEQVAIGGGKDYPVDELARRQWLSRIGDQTLVPEDRLTTLLDRYGTRAESIARFCAAESDEPLRHHQGYSRREIEFIVRNESVMHLDDLVLRRTAIALFGELTGPLLDELAAIVSDVHRWPKEHTDAEIHRATEILKDRFGVTVSRSASS